MKVLNLITLSQICCTAIFPTRTGAAVVFELLSWHVCDIPGPPDLGVIGGVISPIESIDFCKTYCAERDNCVSFQYDVRDLSCSFSTKCTADKSIDLSDFGFPVDLYIKTATTPLTSVMDAIQFELGEPTVTFYDHIGDLKLLFSYPEGKNATSTEFTLFKYDCETLTGLEILEKEGIGYSAEGLYNITVGVDKAKLSTSLLVTHSTENDEDKSKGVLKFCTKAEGMFGTTSVSFLKTKIELAYDLTKNSFEVENNNIVADSIDMTAKAVTTKYNVGACRCNAGAPELFACLKGDLPILGQDSLVGICLKPNSTDVEISNYEMFFNENTGTKYIAATIGESGAEAGSTLSLLSVSAEKTHKVVSRLVTSLFDNGAVEVDVTGNAYLIFSQRRLTSGKTHNLRQLEDNLGDSAGESSFSLGVEIEKVARTRDEQMKKSSYAIPLVGAALAVIIGFVLYKKIA